MIYIDLYIARVELFNGKGGLVEGRIESIDRSGVDFEAVENPKLVSQPTTQWHVFAAFSEFLENLFTLFPLCLGILYLIYVVYLRHSQGRES